MASNTNYDIDEIFSTIPIIDSSQCKLIPYNDMGIFLEESTNMLAKWVNKRELVASFITGTLCMYNGYFLGANIYGYYEEVGREDDLNYMMFMEEIQGKVLKQLRGNQVTKLESSIYDALYFQIFNCGIIHQDFHNANIIIDNSDRIRIIDYEPVLIGNELPDNKMDLFNNNMYRIFRKVKYEPAWIIKQKEEQAARLQEKLNKLKKK